jgi:hypothetical protein
MFDSILFVNHQDMKKKMLKEIVFLFKNIRFFCQITQWLETSSLKWISEMTGVRPQAAAYINLNLLQVVF